MSLYETSKISVNVRGSTEESRIDVASFNASVDTGGVVGDTLLQTINRCSMGSFVHAVVDSVDVVVAVATRYAVVVDVSYSICLRINWLLYD